MEEPGAEEPGATTGKSFPSSHVNGDGMTHFLSQLAGSVTN